MPRATPNHSFEQSVPAFLAYLKDREKSDNTIRSYRSDLGEFRKWFEATLEEPLADILQVTGLELREWKKDMIGRGHRPASVNRRLSAVQSFERWAAETSLIPGAPERPTSCRQQRPALRWLERKERLAFLRAVERGGSNRDRALAIVLLNTGLRVAEAADLIWSDITITERKGELKVRNGKGYKLRIIPLNDDARKALLSIGYKGHASTDVPIWQGKRGPLTVQGIQKVIETFGAAAGLRIDGERGGLSCHVLRHTFCHDLLAAGVGLEKVASLAGHDSIETTRRYVEASQADLQAAVDSLGDKEELRPKRRA